MDIEQARRRVGELLLEVFDAGDQVNFSSEEISERLSEIRADIYGAINSDRSLNSALTLADDYFDTMGEGHTDVWGVPFEEVRESLVVAARELRDGNPVSNPKVLQHYYHYNEDGPVVQFLNWLFRRGS